MVATICGVSVSDNTSLIEYMLFDQKLAIQIGGLIWLLNFRACIIQNIGNSIASL